MNKIGGVAYFIDKPAFTADDIIVERFSTEKMIICKGKVGEGDSVVDAVAVLKQHGFLAVVALSFDEDFESLAEERGITPVTLSKKDIADMFKTFAEKDTEANLIETDEGVEKVKLISGSLSKSYILNPED